MRCIYIQSLLISGLLGGLEVHWQGSFHWLDHMVCPQLLALTPRHRLRNEPNPLPGGWHAAVKNIPRGGLIMSDGVHI